MRWAAFAALLLASAAAAEPRLALESETAEPVFLHRRDACEQRDVPDTPARAWRGADGNVSLVASHAVNRRMVGPSLDRVKQDCAVIYRGSGRDRPEAHDDRSWISATYTLDGTTIHALLHNEFHGQHRPTLCPAANYRACWRNSITAAASGDGGASFRFDGLVAGLPYRFRGDAGRPTGIFGTSNIFKHDGRYYVFVWADGLEAQPRGACLLRTERLGDARSWRAFDGTGFGVRFADPDREDAIDPARHVCAPVAPQALASTVRSVVWHAASKRWIAIQSMARRTAPDAVPTVGIWWTSSADLLRWSAPRLLWATPLLTHLDCGRTEAVYYPALLDPGSDSRNFETVGDRAWLYVTRLNLEGCRITWNRDLVRLPVRIAAD
ncbi:hypothetical protein [Desertibaculum subflavum]|uniref:hypothetical protein n=1 Tax=Desertibaculum subflavum TaxID=2268458 RepID=UPI000E66C89B